MRKKIDKIIGISLTWAGIKANKEIKFQRALNPILDSIIYLQKYLYKIYCPRGGNPLDSDSRSSQESSHIGDCSLHSLWRTRRYLQYVERNLITVLNTKN